MCSTKLAFDVTQPGDPDYPLKTQQGAAGSIAEIRKRFNRENPYEDPDFPANDESIGQMSGDLARGEPGAPPKVRRVWLRPHEICAEHSDGKPQFAVAQADQAGGDGSRCSALDICQGNMGDCWWLAGLATLTSNRAQFNVVVPEDNYDGFEESAYCGAYCGAFHFRFYNMQVEKYVDVVVDDRIPCGAKHRRPAFVGALLPQDKGNEFWVALVEKAFAKYRGAYRAIEGGGTATALELFTGGFAGSWNLDDFRGGVDSAKAEAKYEELTGKVRRYLAAKQYLGLGGMESQEDADAAGCGDGYAQSESGLGLICAHCYSVLGGAELAEKGDLSKKHLLLKIKNPWACNEWKGRFSDGDDAGWATLEWDLRPRNAAGSDNVDDGVFWMDLRDVIKYFACFDYCLDEIEVGLRCYTIRSAWPAELQDKKLVPHLAKYFHNYPAFTFEVKRELLGIQIPPEHKGKCVSALRITVGEAGVHLDPVPQFWYFIFELFDEDDLGADAHTAAATLANIYDKRRLVADSETTNAGNVMSHLDIYLPPGRYFIIVNLKTDDEPPIIPRAYAGKAVPFALSLYSENGASLKQIF